MIVTFVSTICSRLESFQSVTSTYSLLTSITAVGVTAALRFDHKSGLYFLFIPIIILAVIIQLCNKGKADNELSEP